MPERPLQSLVNGQQAAHISIRDRGFQYGDGCFETVRVVSNNPILWDSHIKRLEHACRALQLAVDFNLLETEVALLLDGNTSTDVLLKITITRGESGRGYSPAADPSCSRVLQLVDYTAVNLESGASLFLCEHRLSSNAYLAGIKHLNRLDQVLASAEIPANCDEGLCREQEGYVVEGCRSNIVLVIKDELITPDLSKSGVRGVMLNHLIDQFARQGHGVIERRIGLDELQLADEMFLCNSVFGVWPVARVQNLDWHASAGAAKPYTAAAIEIRDRLFGCRSA